MSDNKCQLPEIFATIDLEMSQPENNIIQIGACIGNVRTGEILETGSYYVKVQESLTEYINTLTGITDYTLHTQGTTLLEAYGKFKTMCEKHGTHASVVQWGQGDEYKLKKDLLAQGMDTKEWIFGFRSFDVKTLYQARCLANGTKMQSGLAKSMTKMGLRFKGIKHNAESDAINTFVIFMELLKKIKN